MSRMHLLDSGLWFPTGFAGARIIPASGGAAPTVASVATSGGSVGDISGAYPATVTGTGFTGATGVTFGAVAATSVVVVNASTLTCVVPAHATGTVSVLVTTALGTNPANALFRYYSPAEKALTAWWRASFTTTTWSPNASAGVSLATGQLVPGVAPSVGPALQGHTVARLDGVAQYLVNGAQLSTIFTAGAGSIVVLFKPAAAKAAQPPQSEFMDPYCFGDGSNGGLGLSYSTAGFKGFLFDGSSSYKSIASAFAVGAWASAIFTWDSTNLNLLVNGAAAAPVGASAFGTSLANTASMGAGYLPGANNDYLQGDMAEVIAIDSALSAQEKADLRSYFNTRYFPAGAQV